MGAAKHGYYNNSFPRYRVQEFCDKGCLKEAISEGVFVSHSQQASPNVTAACDQTRQQQQQQHGAEGGNGGSSGALWPLPTIHKEVRADKRDAAPPPGFAWML